jgi:hypothetical protein
MSVIAAIRPDSWNFPLFVHVLGATLLVGGTLTGASTLAFARNDPRFLRLGYWTLLIVALPAYIVMRIGAEWIADKEGWNDLPEGVDDPTWLGIGYTVADLGALVLLVSLILGGIGVNRLKSGGGSTLLKITMVLALVLLAGLIVAAWAMAGKPD